MGPTDWPAMIVEPTLSQRLVGGGRGGATSRGESICVPSGTVGRSRFGACKKMWWECHTMAEVVGNAL